MTKKTALMGTTTGLAGAIAIAGASQAYGSVAFVATPANYTPTGATTAATRVGTWDVNQDGNLDFAFGFSQASLTGNFFIGIYGNGGTGIAAGVGTYEAYGFYLSRLAVGNAVGSASSFGQNTGYYSVLASRYAGNFYGNFVSATGATQAGWVGFEFTAADGIHYGALNLAVNRYQSAADPGGFRFLGAEYETVAGQALTITAVPEPTSLAALAFGAVGAAGVVLRRRKTAAETLAA